MQPAAPIRVSGRTVAIDSLGTDICQRFEVEDTADSCNPPSMHPNACRLLELQGLRASCNHGSLVCLY